MKRWIWILVLILPLVAAAITLVARPRKGEWTTTSSEALAEFEAGNESLNRVYLAEALEHYGRSHQLDPDFVMATWRYATLLDDQDPETARELFAEVEASDTSGLSDRETFVIERWRANRAGRFDDAWRLLDEYTAKHPNDPYGVSIKANQMWRRGDFKEATRLFQHLLELDPNWVTAYNALGYIAMTQGQFSASEEYFKSYRFVVPGQANPHDSLGQLFIILGRWAEAEESLEHAIELKPDFWASYQNLVVMKAHAGDREGARAVIARARAQGMPEDTVLELDCLVHYTDLAGRGAWRQILDQRDTDCVTGLSPGYATIITHRAACRLGDWETVQKLEDAADGALLDAERSGDEEKIAAIQATIHHLQGVRFARQGDFTTAQDRLRAADRRLTFLQTHQGIFKLYNQMILVETLLADGQDAQAHQLLAEIRGTNPPMVAEFERSRFRLLGLDRG